MGNAERFLDAFNEIEAELERRQNAKQYVPFVERVRATKDLTEPQKDILRKWANLRNVIVHTPGGGVSGVIADPRSDVVEAIEQQRDLLLRPPRALSVLKSVPPTVLDAEDSISCFLAEVALPKDFSQSPVRMNDGTLSLITTNAFARWVADSYDVEGAIVEDAPIARVLDFAEPGDAIRVCDRSLTAVQTWRIFSGTSGVAPAAIAITSNGKMHEAPLGLVVKADVPALLRALGL